MRKDFGKQTWLYPMPVLIIATYGEDGTPDAMNAAWGGIHDTNQICICLSEEHKTVQNIFARKEFTVSPATASQTIPADYVGLVSGNQVGNKVEKAGWHTSPAPHVNAPVIDELPMALECRFVSYDEASGLLVADIVNVCADESVLGEDGQIDVSKLRPITFDPVHHAYLELGVRAGGAFSDGKQLF